jgi:hypothetical protein
MAPIRRVVLDILKPHEPTTVEMARTVADIDGVDGLNATLVETDQEVQNLKLTIEGDAIDYDRLEATVTDLGGSIHSVDQVVCGEYLVEERPTPQD